MHRAIVFLLVAFAAVVLAEGQYYVPRAYYTIDSDGHASIPVPLRRLRRSYNPASIATANANANANANAYGSGSATANAHATARVNGNGVWALPSFGGEYGSSNPNLLRH